MTTTSAPDSGYPTRDVPPDVLSAADRVSLQIERLLARFPVTLAAMAYRRGRDDAAGGPADISHAALSLTAKAVNNIRPGVEPNTALAVMQALLALGWRPPPQAGAAEPVPADPNTRSATP